MFASKRPSIVRRLVSGPAQSPAAAGMALPLDELRPTPGSITRRIGILRFVEVVDSIAQVAMLNGIREGLHQRVDWPRVVTDPQYVFALARGQGGEALEGFLGGTVVFTPEAFTRFCQYSGLTNPHMPMLGYEIASTSSQYADSRLLDASWDLDFHQLHERHETIADLDTFTKWADRFDWCRKHGACSQDGLQAMMVVTLASQLMMSYRSTQGVRQACQSRMPLAWQLERQLLHRLTNPVARDEIVTVWQHRMRDYPPQSVAHRLFQNLVQDLRTVGRSRLAEAVYHHLALKSVIPAIRYVRDAVVDAAPQLKDLLYGCPQTMVGPAPAWADPALTATLHASLSAWFAGWNAEGIQQTIEYATSFRNPATRVAPHERLAGYLQESAVLARDVATPRDLPENGDYIGYLIGEARRLGYGDQVWRLPANWPGMDLSRLNPERFSAMTERTTLFGGTEEVYSYGDLRHFVRQLLHEQGVPGYLRWLFRTASGSDFTALRQAVAAGDPFVEFARDAIQTMGIGGALGAASRYRTDATKMVELRLETDKRIAPSSAEMHEVSVSAQEGAGLSNREQQRLLPRPFQSEGHETETLPEYFAAETQRRGRAWTLPGAENVAPPALTRDERVRLEEGRYADTGFMQVHHAAIVYPETYYHALDEMWNLGRDFVEAAARRSSNEAEFLETVARAAPHVLAMNNPRLRNDEGRPNFANGRIPDAEKYRTMAELRQRIPEVWAWAHGEGRAGSDRRHPAPGDLAAAYGSYVASASAIEAQREDSHEHVTLLRQRESLQRAGMLDQAAAAAIATRLQTLESPALPPAQRAAIRENRIAERASEHRDRILDETADAVAADRQEAARRGRVARQVAMGGGDVITRLAVLEERAQAYLPALQAKLGPMQEGQSGGDYILQAWRESGARYPWDLPELGGLDPELAELAGLDVGKLVLNARRDPEAYIRMLDAEHNRGYFIADNMLQELAGVTDRPSGALLKLVEQTSPSRSVSGARRLPPAGELGATVGAFPLLLLPLFSLVSLAKTTAVVAAGAAILGSTALIVGRLLPASWSQEVRNAFMWVNGFAERPDDVRVDPAPSFLVLYAMNLARAVGGEEMLEASMQAVQQQMEKERQEAFGLLRHRMGESWALRVDGFIQDFVAFLNDPLASLGVNSWVRQAASWGAAGVALLVAVVLARTIPTRSLETTAGKWIGLLSLSPLAYAITEAVLAERGLRAELQVLNAQVNLGGAEKSMENDLRGKWWTRVQRGTAARIGAGGMVAGAGLTTLGLLRRHRKATGH